MDATITDCSHEEETQNTYSHLISIGKISITTSSLYIREMITTLETTPITTHQNFKLRPISKLSVEQGRIFFGCKSTILRIILLKDHNAVTPVGLESVIPMSRVKHSTTEPLRSLFKLKSPITTAADNKFCYIFQNF